jgi:tetratricopeptide (TPR) repeat protein
MRNTLTCTMFVIFVAMLVGCEDQKKAQSSRATLQSGYAALESQQYEQAIAQADAYLKMPPAGPAGQQGSAEALYLRGRGFEGRAAGNPGEAKANLQNARTAYISALGANPRQPLESYIRTSLANVAYFQDDYATALRQWLTAYDALDRDDVKSWALYRAGVCQQRLGQFADADKTFAAVMQRHANSPAAEKAREKQGARGFYVQLATFATPASADSAANSLRKEGALPTRTNDAQGRPVVRVGPVNTYAAAQALAGRFAGRYPGAVIVP